MKYKKIIVYAVMFMAVVFLDGCGILADKVTTTPADLPVWSISVSNSERNYVAALQLLRSGNELQARNLFDKVVGESYQAGVADEAMFRLALLSLRDEEGKGERRSVELFEKLTKEFPESIWTRQAAPVYSYLKTSIVLRSRVRELKSLRNQNLSLSRDNKELRENLDRLKKLDIELEQKIRR